MARGAGFAHGELEIVADENTEIELQIQAMERRRFRRGGD